MTDTTHESMELILLKKRPAHVNSKVSATVKTAMKQACEQLEISESELINRALIKFMKPLNLL